MTTRLWSLVLGCWLFAGLAYGQSQATSGQITGRVVDPSNAVLPGVTVRISNAATGFSRETLTNGEGAYTAPLLPSGTYDVTAELQGFRTAKASNVSVTVGSNVTVNLTMQVGVVSETLIVTAQSPLVETSSTTQSTTLNATAIEKLPINGRRFQDLVVLTPNAQIDTSRGQISLSGQRGINSNISIDGADYNQPFFGGIRGGERSNFAPTIPQESIQEFQVVASGYSAEFGRSSGGLVNVVTKSGTNASSGSGFYVNRHRDLANNNVFGQKAAPTQQQWGGSFGAPLKRDKAFVFGAYEQQKVNIPRAVLFDNLQGFSPTPATQEAFDYYKSLETSFTQTNDAVTGLARVDYQFSASRRINVRYSGSKNEGLNATSVGNSTFPTTSFALSNNGTEKDQTNSVVGQYTDAGRSHVLFELRGQYSREKRPRDANTIAPNVTTNVGRYGTVNFLGQNLQFDWRAQATGNVTWIAGNHSVKAGAELNHVFADQTFGFNQTGGFSISGTNTATILDTLSVGGPTPNRFDSSTVTYLLQIGNLRLSMDTNEVATFVQDSWRIRPNFTLSYGLRWEGQWNPSPEATNASLVNRVKGFTFPAGQVDPTLIPDALNQVGPRIGFAWDPGNNAKTVIRGNAGVYYARSPALIFTGPINNFRLPPGDLSVQLPFTVPASNPNKTVYQQMLLIGVDLNKVALSALPRLTPDQLTQIVQALGLAFDPYSGAQPTLMDPNFENPRAFQWGFGAERELRPGFSVGAEYSDVKTTHLQRNFDMNMPLPVVRASDPAQRPFFGLRSGTPRPVPSLGQVTDRQSTAKSQYRGLTLRARVQRKWAQVNAFYVLSKSLSDDDNERDAGGYTFENEYNLAPEYSYARLDRRHQFSGGVVFFLPAQVEAATGFQLRSGVPIDASMGADTNEDRGGPDRPFSAPGVPFKRNAFRNQPTYNVNLHLQKNFGFAQKQKLALMLDVFNLFNFDNIQYAGSQVTNYCASPVPATCGFDAPSNPNFLQVIDQNPTSTTFGKYLLNNNPGEPRQVQLGLRFTF